MTDARSDATPGASTWKTIRSSETSTPQARVCYAPKMTDLAGYCPRKY
ncbi:MAG: hypothetical protein ISR40_04370 [Puniceicoccaceae bacterium]|nr:hypothetical protein [Puniceicoccaceae bacterium]